MNYIDTSVKNFKDIYEMGNEEREQALLGSMLIDEDVIELFINNYLIEYFQNHINYKIVEAIYEMKLDGIRVDLLTLKTKLEEAGLLEKIGGVSYLVELTEIVPSSANWESYAKILEDLYKRREIIRAANKLINKAKSREDFEDTIEDTMSSLNNINTIGKSHSTSIEDNILLLEKHIEQNKGKTLIGYSWGIGWLDNMTGGIRKSKTYRIGAPSGVGKSNIIYQTIPALLEQGAKVLFISLENTIETTYIKILSSVQGVNSNAIETGAIGANVEWLKKYKNKFILTDKLFDIGAIKREVLKQSPDVVILDYIGLVNIKGTDERTKYDKYADEIKEFVQTNQNLAWIDLSNLNKDDNEEKIRAFMGFNGSAKLRNNTDFALHLFHYKPFYDFKNTIMSDGTEEAKDKIRGRKVLTFFITKNRLGRDMEEEEFVINFNEGIRYNQATDEMKTKWKEQSIL